MAQLRDGFIGLSYLKENSNPNFEAQAIQNLNQMRVQNAMQPRTHLAGMSLAQTDGINYETQSLQSGVRYTQSAIGEMNLDELHQLIEKNNNKQTKIVEKFEVKKKSIITYEEANQQMKDKWSTKEQYYDDSTSYPSYGRGMHPPNINMNTFMIQQ